MSNFADEQLKLLIGICLFLAEEHGFTQEKQVEYLAKSEIFMDVARENPEEFREKIAEVRDDFGKLLSLKKDQIKEDLK